VRAKQNPLEKDRARVTDMGSDGIFVDGTRNYSIIGNATPTVTL